MNRRTILMMIPLLAPMVAGCGTTTTIPDMGGADMTQGMPDPPALGMQIDRMGRAAVNTALTDPFDIPALVGGKTKAQIQDAYNAEADPTKWATSFGALFQTHLAIFDGVDGTCGNQVAVDKSKMDAHRYDLLTSVLADDRLLVDTTQTSCAVYLGVEAAVVLAGIPPDCGGRTPTENTVDETYSLLAIGMPAGVTNGVMKDAEGAPGTTFPFLGAPN